jgi:4,5-dihydroxyphthalate decarboxylase
LKTLTIGTVGYDRVAAFRDGKVSIAGYDTQFREMGPGDIHKAVFNAHTLHVGEVSPSNLAKAIDGGDTAYVGLPTFLSRAFRHGLIYIKAGSKIKTPRDLAGARIGTMDFFGTTAILQRGILQDDYGVDLKKVSWVIGPIDDANDYNVALPSHVSKSFTVTTPAAGDCLSAMMERGELDAILALRAPRAFGEGKMVRLFEDYVAVEKDYYRRTLQFPVMHISVLRRDLAEADPDLPRKVYQAFLKAKDLNQETLKLTMFYYASLPWLPAAVEQARDTFGDDLWPYGLKDGGEALKTFLRYCQEQTLTSRLITMEEMFPFDVE